MIRCDFTMTCSRWLRILAVLTAMGAPSCTSVGGTSAEPATPAADGASSAVDPAVRPARPTRTDATGSAAGTLIPTATVVRPIGQVGDDGVTVPLATDTLAPPDSVAVTTPLEARLERILDQPPFDGMFWGLMVRETGSGRVVYERNAGKRFVPASAMKVLTTAAALRELGPDYRYRTEIYRNGPVRAGVLEGSLFIAAAGDPTWSSRFRSGWRQPMEDLADQIRAAGIRRVERVVVDASRWDSASVVGTWQVEDVPWGWAASGGAMVAADGALRLRVVGSRTVGRPAAVTISPELPSARFDGEVMTTVTDSVRLTASYHHGERRIILRGEVPRQRRYGTSLAMRDPVRITTELLLDVFREKGITVEHGAGYAWDLDADLGNGCGAGRISACSGMDLVATLESPTLMTIAKATLEPSQNWIAEQLMRTLALESTGRAELWAGLEKATEILTRDFGVEAGDLDLHDGSGLSSYTLVTPRAMVAVLERLGASDLGDGYKDALASPGEVDSTLERRLGGMEARVSAKTGTLHHVNSLAGFLTRDDGQELVFAIMSNSSALETDDVRAALDQVVRALARAPLP